MWKETIFKVIQMSVSHMYVSLGAGSASSVPIFRSESLTPLDRPQMGTNNVTYATFTPGAPPAAKFNIKGVDTCKRASPAQCGEGPMQARRLAAGQYLTWAMYERE